MNEDEEEIVISHQLKTRQQKQAEDKLKSHVPFDVAQEIIQEDFESFLENEEDEEDE